MCTMAGQCRELGRKLCQKFAKHRATFCTKSDDWPVVPVKDVERFIEDCMKKVGTRPAHATSLAQNLVAADHRGHYSHGLNRLGR